MLVCLSLPYHLYCTWKAECRLAFKSRVYCFNGVDSKSSKQVLQMSVQSLYCLSQLGYILQKPEDKIYFGEKSRNFSLQADVLLVMFTLVKLMTQVPLFLHWYPGGSSSHNEQESAWSAVFCVIVEKQNSIGTGHYCDMLTVICYAVFMLLHVRESCSRSFCCKCSPPGRE